MNVDRACYHLHVGIGGGVLRGYENADGNEENHNALQHRSNENKMSDGGRGRAFVVEMWKSSQMSSGQRSVVRSIAWLDLSWNLAAVEHGKRLINVLLFSKMHESGRRGQLKLFCLLLRIALVGVE